MKKTLIIVGSSRKSGNTYKLIQQLDLPQTAEIIELIDYKIDYYNYNTNTATDDFMALVQKMLAATQIVFASPVYWYSMSAVLKTYIDRFSDLITTHKELGRQLAGKNLYVLSCGSHSGVPNGFEIPFEGLAKYMDMTYGGFTHGWIGSDNTISAEVVDKLQALRAKINRA